MKRLIGLLVVLGFFVGVAGVYTADAAVKKVVKKKVVKKVVKKAAPKKVAPRAFPAPVAPAPPPPPPVAVRPAPAAVSAGLFGWGINTSLGGAYVNTGKGSLSGSIGLSGDWILDDFVGLGPMVGLSAKAVKYTVGLGGFYGGGGLKAIPVRAGGIIMLPADMMGGLE